MNWLSHELVGLVNNETPIVESSIDIDQNWWYTMIYSEKASKFF